jgi:hypothetical protein
MTWEKPVKLDRFDSFICDLNNCYEKYILQSIINHLITCSKKCYNQSSVGTLENL